MKFNRFYCYILLAFVISCGKKQEQTKVIQESISESVYASGLVKSKNQYQVYSTVNGLVEKIIAQEGSLVKPGDPILSLTNTSSKLNAQTAKLASELAEQNVRGEKLRELKSSIELARAKVKNDSLLYVRQQNLWAQKIGTLVELEQRELAYKNSTTNYETAQLRYTDTKKQLDFLYEQAKNNSQISASLENDFVIRSESNGRLYTLLKEKGELVTAASPIAVIGDADEFTIEMQVDEYDITKIKNGQKILLSLDSYKGKTFEAKVTKVNSLMNERSRSFTVEAEFTARPEKLYPNLTIEANILIFTKEKALTIPRNFLVNDSFVITKNNEKQKVITGLKDYRKVEIVGGLNANDIILKPGK